MRVAVCSLLFVIGNVSGKEGSCGAKEGDCADSR
jgi:hypothetical protein